MLYAGCSGTSSPDNNKESQKIFEKAEKAIHYDLYSDYSGKKSRATQLSPIMEEKESNFQSENNSSLNKLTSIRSLNSQTGMQPINSSRALPTLELQKQAIIVPQEQCKNRQKSMNQTIKEPSTGHSFEVPNVYSPQQFFNQPNANFERRINFPQYQYPQTNQLQQIPFSHMPYQIQLLAHQPKQQTSKGCWFCCEQQPLSEGQWPPIIMQNYYW